MLGGGNSRIAVSAFIHAAQYKEKQSKYPISHSNTRGIPQTDLNVVSSFSLFIEL